MTILSISIKRYEVKHGGLPDKLDSLVPEMIACLPLDPMSGKAFGYRVDGQCSYVLYSVGLDGIDNGGDASGPGRDWGFWTGPDAVWPSAAPAPELRPHSGLP